MQLIGFGIDIVDMDRNEFNDLNFARRYMTHDEYKVFKKVEKTKLFACGIWCLKEAIIKATNHKFLFSEISINFTNEAPSCDLPGLKLFLTISYEKKIAVASAICFQINGNE